MREGKKTWALTGAIIAIYSSMYVGKIHANPQIIVCARVYTLILTWDLDVGLRPNFRANV